MRSLFLRHGTDEWDNGTGRGRIKFLSCPVEKRFIYRVILYYGTKGQVILYFIYSNFFIYCVYYVYYLFFYYI